MERRAPIPADREYNRAPPDGGAAASARGPLPAGGAAGPGTPAGRRVAREGREARGAAPGGPGIPLSPEGAWEGGAGDGKPGGPGEAAGEAGEGPGGEALRSPLDQEKKFRLVKYFSSVAIAVIFASCLALAAIMSGEAEDIIYSRIVDDTVMIMDNLNYQMFNHFLLPIYREKGNARLSEPEAYTFLNSVIEDTVYGFDISRVALYDARYGMRIYTSDSSEPVVTYRPSPETGELLPQGEFAEPMGAYLEAITKATLPRPAPGLVPGRAGTVYGGLMSVWRETGRAGREEH
ncbi:MAG: hypothetical protein LBG06_10660, partial [Deltaproteobacteria bacterium]|nr:hypothetical protein [Deltaproteobacteria bacterium]